MSISETKRVVHYRSRTEFIFSILSSIGEGGETITKIVYKNFCRYDMTKDYRKELESIGLIRYDSDLRLYKLTNRGHSYCDVYGRIRTTLGEDEIE